MIWLIGGLSFYAGFTVAIVVVAKTYRRSFLSIWEDVMEYIGRL